jgi:adenosylhomocysteinase
VPDDRADCLRSILDRTYDAPDHPALIEQTEKWRTAKPFDGLRVVDASPVFGNTLAKYVPLLAGGADLTVSLSPILPHDRETVGLLGEVGVPVVTGDSSTDYDVVLDCAGVLAATPSRAGYVELTKSGERVYESCRQPVFLADDSRVKHIETTLGTGDGFIRGLAHFGHSDLSGRSLVVFGSGKVGRGAAMKARGVGADVTLIDSDPHAQPPAGCTLIPADDVALQALLASAWCVVSATGVRGALDPWAEFLIRSDAVLANLGADDEFGPHIPPDRVLHDKAPVNFALAEPTRLRYLDATFALHNACALALLVGGQRAGLNRPPRAIEDEILAVVRASSAITGELAGIEQELR